MSLPTVYVLLAALLWSTGGLGVKSVDMAPLALAGLRSAFAIPVLALAMVAEARRKDIALGDVVRRPLVWAAAVSYAVMVVTFVVACKLTTAANAIILQYTGPVYVALLSWPLLRERLRTVDVLATAGCVLGMVLLFFERVSAQGRVGDLVAVASSLGFAGVPLLMRLDHRKGETSSAVSGGALGPLVAMVIGNGLALLVCSPSIAGAPAIDGSGWATIGALGVFQIGVAYVLYAAAVNALPALRSTLIATIEPVLNPLWVALVRGERPSRFAALGGVVILASVTMQAVFRSRAVSSP